MLKCLNDLKIKDIIIHSTPTFHANTAPRATNQLTF